MKFQHTIFKCNFMRSLLLLGAMALGLQTVKSQITYPYNFMYVGNPLVRNHGAADPDVHVWNDTVWMYCSQDHQVVNGDTYATMDGYHAFSSVDLINWTDHGEILHSRDVSWGVDGFMWAPGAARKIDVNGICKYYLYYPHHDKSHNWRIGVATSDSPQGPFTDIGNYMSGTDGIDPACFIDDDGEAYLYFGSTKVAKLKPNMIELAESSRNINYAPQEILDDDLQRFHEGAFMHKKDGKYYYSYTNFKHANYGGWYAMGDSPYGPFTWKGPMAPCPKGAQDHHSIIEFKNQWYYFYHIAVSGIPVNKEGQGRIACFDRLYYNKDGTIQMVVHTAGPTKILKTNAPNGSVILNPPGGAYAPGKIVTVTANDDLGFAFNSWSGDLSGSENPTTIVMNTDKSVSANFITTPTYSLSINSTNGSVLLNPPGGLYNSGAVVSLTPVKDFGYKFSSWSGDLSGSLIPGIITMVSNKDVTANFNSVPTYNITSNATNGIIELNPPGGIYEEGTTVTINALQDFGYQFSGWSGDLSGMNNPATLLTNSGKNITANFSYVGEGKIVFATNSGGKAFRSGEGVYYSSDSKYSGGGTYSSNTAIAGTVDDVLYQTERMGSTFSYKIPLPNNDYKLILMFAEIYHGSAGSRVFNVFIEGIKVSSNLDIWAKVGKNTAYVETHAVTVSDGELNISFTTIKDNAKISAIKIVLPDPVSGINDLPSSLPEHTKMEQIFPNPFTTKTTIHYQLNEATPVKLSIYNSIGELMTTLVNEYQPAGYFSVDWNAADRVGKLLGNGLYLIKLEAGNKSVQTMKTVLLK
jgi:arabinoxylan arabinofuranohydrolase